MDDWMGTLEIQCHFQQQQKQAAEDDNAARHPDHRELFWMSINDVQQQQCALTCTDHPERTTYAHSTSCLSAFCVKKPEKGWTAVTIMSCCTGG